MARAAPDALAWIRRYRPDVYVRAATVVLCKDFIGFRLTGERVFDISDMSGCGLLRMPDCAHDGGLMVLYGLADATGLLPRLAGPAEVVGGVTEEAARATGLARATPVVGG